MASIYNGPGEISAEDAAKVMRSGLSGRSDDFLNEIADSLIDQLIAKDPEVSKLITALIYRKIKSLDIGEAIKKSIKKIADEEFKDNILGVINMRVCNIEAKLYDIERRLSNVDSDMSDLRYSNGKLVYSTCDWRGEDVKFTSTCSLSDLKDSLDWMQNEIFELKTKIEDEEK